MPGERVPQYAADLPVGYQASISLVNQAEKIVTDSGGLQREAFFAGKSCVTVFDYVAWWETMHNKCNQLAKPDKADILETLSVPVVFDPAYLLFGDGHSAEKSWIAFVHFGMNPNHKSG